MPETASELTPTTPQEAQEVTRPPDFGTEKQTEKTREEKDPFKLERQKFAGQVSQFLDEKKFYFDKDEFDRQIAEEGRRYLTLQGMMPPGEKDRLPEHRFFKSPLPQRDVEREGKVRESFLRQVVAHDFLDEQTEFPVSELIDFNTDEEKGPMYAFMNYYNGGREIGFLHSHEDILRLKPHHAKLTVAAIRELSHVEKEIKPEVAEVLKKDQPAYQDFEGFVANVTRILDQRVDGAGDYYSPEDKKPLHQILEGRTGMSDFRGKALQLVQSRGEVVRGAQEGIHLVHGDLAPNNLFLGDGQEAPELMVLDFEYLGISGNEVLAAVYDFGNLRARAWNNETFRNALDAEMINSYKAEGREEVGRAIVALGILRSHMNLAGFFENYKPEKSNLPEQTARRETTEADIKKAWEVLGLSLKTSTG